MKAVSLICNNALTEPCNKTSAARVPQHAALLWLFGLGLVAACTDQPTASEPETQP